MINIASRYLEIIRGILRKHVPDYEARAFGSRVNGTARTYSDLDLVIVGKTKLPKKILYLIKEEFEESDLPFRVEIMDWQAISADFRKIIKTRYEVIQTAILKKRSAKTIVMVVLTMITTAASCFASNRLEQNAIIEYKMTGGETGIHDFFLIYEGGCFNLNWAGSGHIKGHLDENKVRNIKQTFEENDFLNIHYKTSSIVSDDFYASIIYKSGENSNEIAFGLEVLKHYQPNPLVSNTLVELNKVISEIIKERTETATEGYLSIEIRKDKLKEWPFKDELNLEQLLLTAGNKKGGVDITKDNIPDKIHKYFISTYSQIIEDKLNKKDSSTLGMAPFALYFQNSTTVYRIATLIDFSDYKANKISKLYITTETHIAQWPSTIDIPLIQGRHIIEDDVYKQTKAFLDSVKVAQFYRLLNNDAETYIITLTPKIDSVSFKDDYMCEK